MSIVLTRLEQDYLNSIRILDKDQEIIKNSLIDKIELCIGNDSIISWYGKAMLAGEKIAMNNFFPFFPTKDNYIITLSSKVKIDCIYLNLC